MNAACPYCRDCISAQDGVKVCHACGTPHHRDCFTENGGCTVFGCVNAPGDEPKIRVLLEDLGENLASHGQQTADSTRTAAPSATWQSASYAYVAARRESRRAEQRYGVLIERNYPAPPNLSWGLLLTFTILTGGSFLIIWDLALAKWMREVQPKSRAIYYYGTVALLEVVTAAGLLGGQINDYHSQRMSLIAVTVILFSLAGRFSLRKSLQDYFDQAGAMGLLLSETMTFFFGTIYFQFHMNRITKQKEERQQAIA